MNGDDVRVAREALGLSRRELGEMIGLTPAQVGRIELRGPRPDEEPPLEELLRKAGVRAAITPESPSAPEVRQPAPEAWGGLQRGQVVKLDGSGGTRVKFLRHVVTEKEEYVEVVSTKNGGLKCVRPERIWSLTGKTWSQVCVPQGT